MRTRVMAITCSAIELAVTAAVKAMAIFAPTRGWYRCRAGPAGEVRVGGEALGAGRAADESRGREHAAALLGEQRRPCALTSRRGSRSSSFACCVSVLYGGPAHVPRVPVVAREGPQPSGYALEHDVAIEPALGQFGLELRAEVE